MALLFSVLVGAVLGMRYKVLALVPTTATGIAIIAALNLVREVPLDSSLRIAVLVVAGLQLGYLAGAAARSLLAAARLRGARAGKPTEDQRPAVEIF